MKRWIEEGRGEWENEREMRDLHGEEVEEGVGKGVFWRVMRDGK